MKEWQYILQKQMQEGKLKFMLVGQKDCTKKRQHVKTAKEHFVDDLQHLLDIKKKKKRKKTLPNSFERVSVETSE